MIGFESSTLHIKMPYDLSRLSNLLGSDDAAARFIELFKQQLPAQLADLRAALESGDFESAGIVAHGLKSQCRYVGLDEAANLLQKLEENPGLPGALRQLEWLETAL